MYFPCSAALLVLSECPGTATLVFCQFIPKISLLASKQDVQSFKWVCKLKLVIRFKLKLNKMCSIKIIILWEKDFVICDISPLYQGHIYLNEKPFRPIKSSLPTILFFRGDFWSSLQKIFYHVSIFYCIQNNHQKPTVSVNKFGVKIEPTLDWDICKNVLEHCTLYQTTTQ